MTKERIVVVIKLPPDRGGEAIEPFEVEIFYPTDQTNELRNALKILSQSKKKK